MIELLPSRPDEATRAVYVSRIIETYAMATDDQIMAGITWYPAAHAIAGEYAGDNRRGAGIIAALSANKSWSENVRLARKAFGGEVGGHFADALGKVRAIIDGADPADVMPMASKTGQFFICIADPADPDAVVVDRHAHDVVAGMKYGNQDRGLKSAIRYASIADAYRVAGKSLGMIPSEVQAIVWGVVTDMARYARSLTGVPGWGVGGDGDD